MNTNTRVWMEGPEADSVPLDYRVHGTFETRPGDAGPRGPLNLWLIFVRVAAIDGTGCGGALPKGELSC